MPASSWSLENRWTGNHLDFRVSAVGQTISGLLDVGEESVTLALQLPWVLAMIAKKAQSMIESKGHLLLDKQRHPAFRRRRACLATAEVDRSHAEPPRRAVSKHAGRPAGTHELRFG